METMDPTASDVPSADAGRRLPPAWLTRALCVLWPAFLMAGLLEMLVFAWIDPAALLGPEGGSRPDAAIGVHSLAFLLFWAAITLAIGLSRLLSAPAGEPVAADGHAAV